MNDWLLVLIIGLIIGVAPSMLVLFLREKKFEPAKWTKDTKWKELTQKLEIYGELNTLLDTGKQRMSRQNLNQNQNQNNNSHLIMIPEDYDTLKTVFGKYRHLLSGKLIDVYLHFIKNDEYFSDVSSKEAKIEGNVNSLNGHRFKVNLKNKQTSVIFCDLTNMEKIVKKEYDELKTEYRDTIN